MFGQNQLEPLLKDHDGHTLDIKEVFGTIQGEGPFVGRPATFVRLGGCHLHCAWCDTSFETGRYKQAVDDLVQSVYAHGNRLVVLTGGEPMRQNIGPLCLKLVHLGLDVQIETAGSFWWPELAYHCSSASITDPAFAAITIVVSPKTPEVHAAIRAHAAAWKYIITLDDPLGEDGLPILSTQFKDGPHHPAARPSSGTAPYNVFIQPCDANDGDETRRQATWAKCVQICRKHGYRLSLQTHKLLGLP